MQSLNRQLENYYSANPDRRFTKVSPLTMAQILGETPGYPYLKAKAAGTRQLAEFGLILARRHRFGGDGFQPFQVSRHHRLDRRLNEHLDLVVEMFEGLVQYTTSCSEYSRQGCVEGMYRFLQSLQALHDMWREGIPLAQQKGLLFHVRPKAHVLQHLVEDKLWLWGSPSTIVAKTQHPHTLEERISEKLMILSGLHAAI